jgi:hypothetical protein
MKPDFYSFPLIKLPADVQTVLFLIQQELKSCKFFDHLNEIGMGDSFFQPHLGTLILAQVGLEDEKDETMNFYVELIDKRSRKIRSSNESVMKQAMKVYVALMAERERRKASGCQ